MKDKNSPNEYSLLTIDQLTNEVNKIIDFLENEKNLENHVDSYQNLLKLNHIIEKKFYKNIKDINQQTKEKISKIILKKNAKWNFKDS